MESAGLTPEEKINRINSLLQEINDQVNSGEIDCADLPVIRLPFHLMSGEGAFRTRKKFIKKLIVRKNLTSHLVLSDFFRWIMERTSAYGKLEEMLIKFQIINLYAISITVIHELCTDHGTYAKSLDELLSKGIINREIHEEMIWLLDFRSGIQLGVMSEKEYGKYKPEHFHRANGAVTVFLEAIESIALND